MMHKREMIGQCYTHYNNRKKYTIVDVCKIQESDIWVDAIIYENEDHEKFVRSSLEFFVKFKSTGDTHV
jgi:hypothetical protein